MGSFAALSGVAITGLAIPGDADTGTGSNAITITPTVANVTVAGHHAIATPEIKYAAAIVAIVNIQALRPLAAISRTSHATSASATVGVFNATTTSIYTTYPPAIFVDVEAGNVNPMITGSPTTAQVSVMALSTIPPLRIVFSATGHPNTPWGAIILPSMWEAAIMSNWSAD